MADYVRQRLGNYHLIHLLGKGGFADVYLGQHIYVKNFAAIKVLHTELTEKQTSAFLAEAQTLARLTHPHIVHLLEFAVEGGTPFLVMEYLPNGTLRQQHPRDTKVPINTVISYVNQISDALEYAHNQRIIHRDIKPDNILLRQEDEIVLTDFGIATIAHGTLSMSTQNQAGTIAYMAPEQIQGRPRPASDQYAVGIMVYEWLCGIRPFHGSVFELYYQHLNVPPPPLRTKEPSISLDVEEAVLKALKKDWQQRFTSVQEFSNTLERAANMPQVSRLLTSSTTSAEPAAPTIEASPAHRKELSNSASSDTSINMTFYPTASLGQITPALDQLIHSSVEKTPSLNFNVSSPPHSPLTSKKKSLFLHKRPSRGTMLLFLGLVFAVITGSTIMLTPTITNVFRGFTQQSIVPTPLMKQSVKQTGFINAPMEGFDLEHSNFNPYEHLLSPTNVSHLTLDWTSNIKDLLENSPAVANGVLYIGTFGHRLYAFNASGCGSNKTSCPPLWTSSLTKEAIASTPAVANGIVFVTSWEPRLYAFNASGCGSGKTSCPPLWTSTITNFPLFSSPMISNGIVFFGSGLGLYAFKASGCGTSTCRPLWVSSPMGDYIVGTPAIADGVVYIISNDGKLYAFNASGCGPDQSPCPPLWTSTSISLSGSPLVAYGTVFVGSTNGDLYVFNASGCNTPPCSPIWVSTHTGGPLTSSAVAYGQIFVSSADQKLYTFYARYCNSNPCPPLWISTKMGDHPTSPTIANGLIFIGSGDHKIYIFNASGCGQSKSFCPPLWVSIPLEGQIDMSPVVINGTIYVGTTHGELYAFHLSSTTS